MPSFAIGDEHFLLDGAPHRIRAGALHYFRVHPDHWADRIHKARLMGLNTIETYIPWNAHAPHRGEFITTGQLDVVAFLRAVAAEGLHAIVRPGPYICAEWDNGGLPAWLFENAAVGIRRNEPLYMAAVTEYFEQILPLLAPLQIDNGGPIILMQVENEYGAYGSDKTYLAQLVRLNRAGGITVPLTTIDQPTHEMLENGRIDGAHLTASFGSRSVERLATLREHQPTGPLMSAEYWNGWFDFWGGHHHVTSVEDSADDLRELMATGASFCLYMFHGGTNFGFTNGANDKGVYQPTITSYDYDAPLAENGEATAKYHAFRSVIAEFHEVPSEGIAPVAASPAFAVALTRASNLLDVVGVPGGDVPGVAIEWQHREHLPTADELRCYDGFTLYRAALPAGSTRVLRIAEVRDRASIFVDGNQVGTLSRAKHEHVLALPGGAAGVLQILVEDQGRVNYGPRIGEPKGLIGSVAINGIPLTGWDALPLSAAHLAKIVPTVSTTGSPIDSGQPLGGPVFTSGSFALPAPTDLFLSTAGFGKGVAWVNGFNLGRYWSAGPQRTLYVPQGALRAGGNELVLLELAGAAAPSIHFVPRPELGSSDF